MENSELINALKQEVMKKLPKKHFSLFRNKFAVKRKQKVEKYLDFAFVDANKAQYIDYFNLIDKILRKGGMIAFDNMLSHKEKVQDTLEAVTNHPDYQSEMIYTEAGILLAVKVR